MHSDKFTKEYEIHYHQIDKNKKATPLSLISLMEETAISHSQSVGLGIDELEAANMVWVLNRWSIEIDSQPSWHDRISVITWPSSFERFYATREFKIKDPEGRTLVRASTLWILINFQKKRPIRIPLEFGDRYGISPVKAIDNPFGTIEPVGASHGAGSFPVRRSDIDTNGHVNNCRYVEWALEQVPQDVYDNCRLQSLEVEYKKETTLGSTVNSLCRLSSEEKGVASFVHSILSEDKSLELASAKTLWTAK